jgi:hypothetical protein
MDNATVYRAAHFMIAVLLKDHQIENVKLVTDTTGRLSYASDHTCLAYRFDIFLKPVGITTSWLEFPLTLDVPSQLTQRAYHYDDPNFPEQIRDEFIRWQDNQVKCGSIPPISRTSPGA